MFHPAPHATEPLCAVTKRHRGGVTAASSNVLTIVSTGGLTGERDTYSSSSADSFPCPCAHVGTFYIATVLLCAPVTGQSDLVVRARLALGSWLDVIAKVRVQSHPKVKYGVSSRCQEPGTRCGSRSGGKPWEQEQEAKESSRNQGQVVRAKR